METISKNSVQRKSVSICQEFNLNTKQLEIQKLMDKTIYRRLYNIVCTETNHNLNDTSYRKNLIRQLYFLLKIVPVMRIDLQDKFLYNLESWYNMNDHKKTQLQSGGLKNLLNQYVKSPSEHNQFQKQRPKSGISWNKSVHPFLRPYTAAKIKNTNLQMRRPQSSNYGQNSTKYGKSGNMSTKLDSCQQLTVGQLAFSIQQQWQISQDFFQKHRTIHPQSQPIYQQLYNILKKVHEGHLQDMPKQTQTQIMFNFDKEDFFQNIIHQEEKPKEEVKNIDIQQKQEAENNFQKVSEESEKDSQNSQLEEGSQKKIYKTDKKAQQNSLNIEQFHFFKPESKNQQLLLKKVNNKYNHLTNNKFVNTVKDDQQIVRKYVNYTRAKSAIKRQLNRKSQTKRILSAKGTRSNTRIFLQQNLAKPLQKFQDRTNLLERKNSLDKIRTYDFSKNFPQNDEKEKKFHLPKYNKRKILNEMYEKQITKYKKSNGCISTSQIKQVRKFPLTKFDNFLSQERIDPLSDYYKQKHNQQALDQIQKIKMKINGKNSVSTDSLMKALYIDNSICSINNQIISSQNIWQGKNPYYGLLSNGTKKKLKKKNRKLKKVK